MTDTRPRFILRNCMLYANGTDYLGQIEDMTPPVPAIVTEDMRNAGMVKPREIHMGYEKLEFGFKMPTVDPEMLKLFGLKPGSENPFMITGWTVSEDGSEHSAVMIVRGFMKKADLGSWKPGEKSDTDYEVAVHYYKLEINGEPIYEMDDFNVSIGGVSQTAGMRAALLLD